MIVFIGPLVVIIGWSILTYGGLVDNLLLPTPSSVVNNLSELFLSGVIARDLVWTCLRWFAGLLLGVLIGVPMGLLMGMSRSLYAAFEIVIDVGRSIPVMAMFPIFMIFFGIGDESKVAVSAWTATLYILINTMYGVRYASDSRRMVAQVFRASWWQTFSGVVLPEALPGIFGGIRVSISMSLVLVVASEMLMGTSAGLGKRVFDAGLTYNIPEMYAVLFVTGALGYVSNKMFSAAEQRIIHWVDK